MKSCGILAASLFGALVAAAPVNKRDVVWVVETAIEIETVYATATVWVGADGVASTSTSAPAFNGNFAHQPKTRHSVSTTSSEIVPVSTSSVYVAPTPSATSVSVEPTPSSVVEPTPTSTSVYVVPTTSSIEVVPTISSTSVYVAPTTEASTSTYVAPTSASSVPAATSSAPAGSSSGPAASGTSYTGDLTWYQTGSGACGWDNVASDHIVAISKEIFDDPAYYNANPNNNPLCGKFVSITGKDGAQHQAKIVDRCVGCAASAIDLSEDFFNLVTDNGDGRVPGMTWSFV